MSLAISSAAVESLIKPTNGPRKGRVSFRKEAGAEALLPVRAAEVSADGRAVRS